ncbi:MAG TPA: pitrilysin family protein [Thermohalobaculum sp.]|nr:pitrilysin family protein [Thermohalobaculum sp.]
MNLTRMAAAVLVVLATGSPARAEPPVSDFRLENGLEVVVIEDHRAPVVTHMVWYRVGAADEPWGRSGIAHFVEHLMFKSTDGLADGEFSLIIAANGGTDNAFTSYDYTAYHQRIAADRLDLVMRMEADRMVNLRLTEEAVETERAVILEERNQRTDNSPQSLFAEQMRAALYQNHPYGLPVIGWRHEMERLSLADAQAFYERYYAPDNAILVVSGDVTPDEVQALAETHYGPLPPSGRPPEARPQEPPPRAPRRLEMRDARVSQPVISRDYLVPSYDSANPRESAALDLLGDLIGRGITARLARALEVEQEIAIDTGAYYTVGWRDPGEFTIWGVPAAGRSLAEVEAAIDAVIAEFIAEGPGSAELDRAKRLARAALIYAQDDQASLARRYGAALASGRSVADVRAWPEVIDAVTAEEVRAVAETYLVPERSVTGWLMGSGEED